MSCPYENENPYFNLPYDTKEESIVNDLKIDFSLDEKEIAVAIEKAKILYETVTVRAHRAISTLIDNLCTYMENATITAGRDGNLTALKGLAKDFDELRQSHKGVAKDLAEEQEAVARGNSSLAYDQM
jgi:hypothetical protein